MYSIESRDYSMFAFEVCISLGCMQKVQKFKANKAKLNGQYMLYIVTRCLIIKTWRKLAQTFYIQIYSLQRK